MKTTAIFLGWLLVNLTFGLHVSSETLKDFKELQQQRAEAICLASNSTICN
jgi:hypothetical protein